MIKMRSMMKSAKHLAFALLVLFHVMHMANTTVAFMEGNDIKQIERNEAVQIAKTLLQETSLVVGNFEDYVENEVLLRKNSNGELYWYISFVRPVESEDEEIINLVVMLTADEGKLIEMATSKRADFEIMSEYRQLLKDRGAFVMWSVEEKNQFIANWTIKVNNLPENTLGEGNRLAHLLKTEHILPVDTDLKIDTAVQMASEALMKTYPDVVINDYKIANSFIMDETEGRIWCVFFIRKDVYNPHPGFRVVINSPAGDILSVVDLADYNIFSQFGYDTDISYRQ